MRILDQIHVASPCSMKWEDMSGDERKRFCGLCRLNVINISDMTEHEVELFFLTETGGRKCIRYHQRSDGTILTKDCKGGAQPQRRSLFVAAAVAVLTSMVALVAAATKPPQEPKQTKVEPMASEIKAKVAGVLRRVPALYSIADELDPICIRGEAPVLRAPVRPAGGGKP